MFPQELHDEIVDWLVDDHPSLMALSCTAQCFRERSQALLFYELDLSPNTNSPLSYMPLLEMSPHILTYVRRLHILAADYRHDMPSWKRFFLHQYDSESLGRFIRAVTNVDDIELTQILDPDTSTILGALLPHIVSLPLRRLSMWSAALQTPYSLHALVSCFPLVSSLHLWNVSVMGTSTSFDSGNNFPTEMFISPGMILSPVGDSLSTNIVSPCSSRLRSLYIERYSYRELVAISELLSQLPNLITLVLKHPLGCPNSQQHSEADIPVFPLQNVQSLHLSFPSFAPTWMRWWVGHLTQTTAVNLEDLEVDLEYWDTSATGEAVTAWKDMEITLAAIQLPKLKSVNVRNLLAHSIHDTA